MLGLILFFQIVIIFIIMLCFIVLNQQHKDININTSTTRHYVSNIIKNSYFVPKHIYNKEK